MIVFLVFTILDNQDALHLFSFWKAWKDGEKTAPMGGMIVLTS